MDFIQSLIETDKDLFLYFNSINSLFWDQIMYTISLTRTWFPLYAVILFFIFKKERQLGFITLLFLFLTVVIADQGSVRLFKDVFMRLRPCHDASISHLVHIVKNKCGGQYGFVSSHASNCFAFATFSSLYFSKKWFLFVIFFWALVVSYSRIYLGVHFPGDVLGGALFGMVSGFLTFFFYRKALILICENKKRKELNN